MAGDNWYNLLMSEDKRPKVLLVDDENILLEMYKTAFTVDGFPGDFLTAAEVGEAIKIIKNEKPDLVLLDMLLGKRSGLDVIKEIKASDETKNIPIIALTNYDVETVAKEAVSLGAEKYLIKNDFTPMALLAEVKNRLNLR